MTTVPVQRQNRSVLVTSTESKAVNLLRGFSDWFINMGWRLTVATLHVLVLEVLAERKKHGHVTSNLLDYCSQSFFAVSYL